MRGNKLGTNAGLSSLSFSTPSDIGSSILRVKTNTFSSKPKQTYTSQRDFNWAAYDKGVEKPNHDWLIWTKTQLRHVWSFLALFKTQLVSVQQERKQQKLNCLFLTERSWTVTQLWPWQEMRQTLEPLGMYGILCMELFCTSFTERKWDIMELWAHFYTKRWFTLLTW